MTELFVAVDSRCVHGNVTPIDSDQCDECKWVDYLLSLKPPFPVKCNTSTITSLTNGSTYTVLACIRDGTVMDGDQTIGFLLRAANDENKDLALPRIFPATAFDIVA